MGNKFIGLIVTVAVCLGLLLVPAAGLAQPEPGPVTASFWAHVPGDYSKSHLNLNPVKGASFDMNITVRNPDPLWLIGAKVYMEFNGTLLNASMTRGEWLGGMPDYRQSNTSGWLWAADSCVVIGLTKFPINGGYIRQAQVHFTLTGVEGSTNVSVMPGNATLAVTTSIEQNGTPRYVENWSAMQNFSVNIATPTLTVHVVGNGSVTAGGVDLVMNATGYNTTTQVWEDTVSLVASPDTGWKFKSWAGQDGADTPISSVDITDSTQLVTVTFEEKAPDLWVNKTNVVFTGARIEINPDDEAILVKNTGGHHLNWTIGSPPEWSINDAWVWNDTWFDGTNGTSISSNLTLIVTGETSDNYEMSANFSPRADRVINSTKLGLVNVTMINATALVDKYSLDMVQQHANLLVDFGVMCPATASVTWDFFGGDHGWPYSFLKAWPYNVTQVLFIAAADNPMGYDITSTTSADLWAVVTNFTNVTALGSPLGYDCWEIVHCLDPTNATTIFATKVKIDYWSEYHGNFIVTADGSTYDYPPMDITELKLYSKYPGNYTPAVPPSWLTLSPMNGSLGIDKDAPVTLSANVTYPDVLTKDIYTGNFTITAPGCILNKTIEVVMDVRAATTVVVERNLPGTKDLPNCTYTGQTFPVYVNFTASRNNFSAIGITDIAPPGWEVAVDKTWCDANGDPADRVLATGNKAEIAWYGEPGVGYPKNTKFVAKYQVTVPGTAKAGLHQFVWDDGSQAWAEYWFGPEGPFTSNVTGERNMTITVWGDVVGETRDVNANLLPNVDVNLRWMNLTANYPGAWRDNDESNPNFALTAKTTGIYYLQGSKDRYNPLDTYGMNPWSKSIGFSTPELLEAGNKTDFEGDFGLVPMACNMSYAMESINHYLFTPIDDLAVEHPEWKITFLQKALESINSWQNPS